GARRHASQPGCRGRLLAIHHPCGPSPSRGEVPGLDSAPSTARPGFSLPSVVAAGRPDSWDPPMGAAMGAMDARCEPLAPMAPMAPMVSLHVYVAPLPNP